MKKLIIGVVVVMLTAVGFVAWYGATHLPKPGGASESKVVTVDRGAVRQIVMASGSIAANYEVDIKCKASGEVTAVPFDVADVVKKGELVLELDPIDERRRVDQAKAALTAAECRLGNAQQAVAISEQTLVTDSSQAQNALRMAEINAKDSRSKASRSKMLMESKLLSVEEMETAETSALRAESSVEDAKNAIAALKTRPISIERDRNEVKLAEVAVDQAKTDLADAEQRLKETKVMAPIDGVVTTRPVQVGSIVSSGITNVGGGSSIMTLSDLSRLFVDAPVNEADIGRVKVEQKVVIRCDAFPEKKFEGKITRIAAKGLSTQSVVTFAVKIEITGEGKEVLKPAMTADVEIVIAEKEKVLRVPSEAVRTRKDQSKYVLVPTDAAGASSAPASASATTGVAVATTSGATGSAPATTAAAAGGTGGKPAGAERTVVVGADDGRYCEIVSGLSEGDKVVVETVSGGDWANLKQDRN